MTPFERGKEARRQGKTLADNVACADALMGALGCKRVEVEP